ncbi:lysyl oxidase family protein [Streptomyces sp. TRM 70361]|uniref:lysyl oxidase family protein n=1 Tax=Streptomyces sp. TRM 70361 TaxID=3116553 RepID=UPI002E7B17B9|nr:lysyl oxidase family protein [Streptomyces sp. TRM 70361]MEE1939318.1 lysyl oxidase family protein [Streptomyces sp. TRM 70361]
MTRPHRIRPWHSALAATTALAVTAGIAAVASAAEDDGADGTPKLGLVAASTSLTFTSWTDSPGFFLDLGTYVTAEDGPLEIRVTRKSYGDPVVATQVVRDGGGTRTEVLPEGLVDRFSGLPGFLEVTVADESGETVLEETQDFCPNNASGRISPDAPATSRYPESCPTNPFTLGSVWGIEEGWAANTYTYRYDGEQEVELPAGKYTATVSVAERYREAFGIADEPRTVAMTVRELSWEDEEGGESLPDGASAHGSHTAGHAHHPAADAPPAAAADRAGPAYNVGHGPYPPAPPALPWAPVRGTDGEEGGDALDGGIGDGPGLTDGSRQAPALKPAAKRPTGKAGVPDVPLPDLRSLPAYGITTTDGYESAPDRDYLAFSANVWNAGPAPLVVDGFRTPGKDLMDAYQYFHDADGKQVGYTPTGTMEWDPREGHEHWHFTDFASYRLLKADKKEAVRSGKEAFCLANTDAVDYTVENADWHPHNTDLSTACGVENSISVREVLDVGSGDTYTQDLPDQSFDITDLPNGTYYIQVLANPEQRLKETDTDNNSALRKVVLGGEKGARTVTVPPHGLVDAN